jgi:hypothetical protein
MKHIMMTLNKSTYYCLLALMAFALPLTAQSDGNPDDGNLRAMAVSIEAEIIEIDLKTREVSLRGVDGEVVTMVSPEKVVKLEDLKVGDKVVANYLVALEGEVREPTEEELATPWLVVEEAGASKEGVQPLIGGARVIRAVCSIEGMNRERGTVTIKDSRGKVHVIGDVEPEKMDGVALGQTIVIVYTEAMALSLNRKIDAGQ